MVRNAIHLVLLIVALTTSLASFARTETVTVADLGGIYEVVVVTEEQSLIPFHPDKGFFPKLRREVRFVTTGPGAITTIDGHKFRRFVINDDIVTILDNCLYSSGEVLFSEQAGQLIINATLSSSHSEYSNHSGTYRNVEYSRPGIATLDKGKSLAGVDYTYVRAMGYFLPDKRQFRADGALYEILDLCSPKENEPAEIFARVIRPVVGHRTPYLYVLRKVGREKMRCCPWGEP
jgi:hypothetical protein